MVRTAKKVILAYSGGLDTSVCIPWIKEKYHCEVIAVAVDLGQEEDFLALETKAIQSGASKIFIKDLTEVFANEYLLPALKAHAVYENKYLLATALGRPLIAKALVDIAIQEGADAVAHGCTGKGNDQVRFDLTFMALGPDLAIIAPVREWEFKSREEEMDYAKRLNIPVKVTKDKPYSIDMNVWGCAIECGVLEDPWQTPPEDIFTMTTLPKYAPDKPQTIELDFEKGVPVALDNVKMSFLQMIKILNGYAGKHGIGISDLIEDRLVGIKSREVYECPAGQVLLTAHRDLENMVLDRDTIALKSTLSEVYARLIYNGQWFSPLRAHIDAFVDSSQAFVTGTVRLELYKGTARIVGRKSPYALYSHALSTYDNEDTFNHRAGEAFCQLWGLPLKIAASVQKKV